MASEARRIELGDIPDFAALVHEVRRSRQPRILRQDGEDVAVLVPATFAGERRDPVRRLRPPTAEQIARSRAGIEVATGSWHDIDADALQMELRSQRELDTRPPIEL